MRIHVLFGQRYCKYPRQFAPEALEVIDEYCMEDCTNWLTDKRDEHCGSGEFSAVEIIAVDLGENSINKIVDILNPGHIVSGEILKDK